MIIKQTNEVILNNFIDEELRSVLLPLNVACYLFLQPKYNSIYGFVTPNSFYSLFKAFLVSCLIVVINYVNIADYFAYLSFLIGSTFVLDILPVSDFVIYFTHFLIIVILVFVQSKNMVNILIKLQTCHRSYRLIKNKSLFKLKVINWLYICLFLGFHITYNVSGYLTKIISIPNLLEMVTLIYFEVDPIYFMSILMKLEFELHLWISELHLFMESERPVTVEDVEIYDAHCTRLFQAYVDIMSAFDSLKQVFHAPIFLYVIDSFIHTMFYVQTLIDVGKMERNAEINEFAQKNLIFVIIWVAKNFLVIAFVGASCEKFYVAVEKTDEACTLSLKSGQLTDSLKTTCKNVLRMRVACFSRVSACGVFSVDAGLVLRLLQLVATYTVVLLQFAFL